MESERAALSDSIEDTVDYQQLSNEVQALIEARHFNLIETVAHEILQLLQRLFAFSYLKITVSKPNALVQAKRVAIVVQEGERHD